MTQQTLLDSIRSPADLRRLDVHQLPQLAQELRAFMVESVSKTGGHLSSSLGATELAIAIHTAFNTPEDRVIWDVGHQAYAHKILKPVPGLWDIAKRMEKQAINFVSPPSGIFSSFDLNYYGPVDGHDVVGLVEVLKNLRRLNCPCVLHVATQKGKGYEPAEMDPTAYHGVGVFDPLLGLPEKKPGRPTYTEVFGRWLCDTAAADKRLYGITPAMREGSGLVEFARRYPERYRDVAIAEQHAVTYAAGLACEGIKPVVAIYSTFLPPSAIRAAAAQASR